MREDDIWADGWEEDIYLDIRVRKFGNLGASTAASMFPTPDDIRLDAINRMCEVGIEVEPDDVGITFGPPIPLGSAE